MGPCPGKRNMDWDGRGVGEEQHHDRPAPHLVATSAPEFESGEQKYRQSRLPPSPSLGLPAAHRQERSSKR